MVIGNAENDLAMIREAGIGVTMANAPHYVKTAVRFITERTNNDAGVAEAIHRWALASDVQDAEFCPGTYRP